MIIFSSQLLCHENIIWQYIDWLSFQTFNWLSSLPQSLSSHLTFYALLLCYFTFQSSYELISFDDLAMLSFQLKRARQWLEIWFWPLVKGKLRSESWFLNDLVIKVFFFFLNFKIEGTQELRRVAWRSSPRRNTLILIGVIIQIQDQGAEDTSVHNQSNDWFWGSKGLYKVRGNSYNFSKSLNSWVCLSRHGGERLVAEQGALSFFSFFFFFFSFILASCRWEIMDVYESGVKNPIHWGCVQNWIDP